MWTERILAQRASGMTQRAWCKAEGISHNTLSGWIKRLGMQEKRVNPAAKGNGMFAKVVSPSDSPDTRKAASSGGVIELSVSKMRLPADYDRERLCELIGAWF